MSEKRSVKIGVVDSGINPYHSHIANVIGGISITVGKNMYLQYDNDYRDRLGHGTAVAAAILDEFPEGELYAIRIFQDSLSAYPTVLCTAIKWAIEQRLDIINLSLGIMEPSDELEALCLKAKEEGIFVICAYDEERGFVFPGRYEGVIAVSSGELCKGEYQYFSDHHFLCCGYPRELNGDIQKYNLYGHSFASARFSGILGKYLQKQPRFSYENVLAELMKNKNNFNERKDEGK